MGRVKRRTRLVIVASVVALAGWVAWRTMAPAPGGVAAPAPSATTPGSGGSLVGSVRAEPTTFNSYVTNRQTEETVAFLTQAKLVRINRVTDEVEPWLAESWQELDQAAAGPLYRIKLREGVTFSDGAPFTSADVLFALDAIGDPRVNSPLADPLRVGGKPLTARALDDHTVEIAYPSAYGPGIRLLDSLWVLPKHKLEPALRAGTFAQAWGLTTPAAEMTGLGPFVLREYRPGERMVFDRNPRYWRRDAQGVALPYLDRLTLEILPDQTAELLRLQSGQLDFTHSAVRSEDYLSLKRAQDDGRVRLLDLGVSLDADPFWFNLSGDDHQAAGGAKPWLRALEFRQAVSLAVDRKAYGDAVFLGAAEPLHGPVTPGNVTWYWPALPGGAYDPARAKTLLAGLGLADRNGDGLLEDAQGRPVRFTVLLQRGIAAVERGADFIRTELARVGVGLDVVGLDAGAVQTRWAKGDYEVIFHRLLATETDPAASLDFWLSSGGAHVWNPGQPKPATGWERQIDDLMRRQVAMSDRAERVQLFRDAQRVFSEHSPVLYFAAPHLFLATSARLEQATPSRLIPLILWNAESLAVAPAAAAARGWDAARAN
jgi:peptide/nickel transport system substrate-binding protein